MTKLYDEHEADAYYEDWMAAVREGKNIASNGQRVTCSLALRIAADVLRYEAGVTPSFLWTDDDLKLALGVIAGIRAQGSCEELDPAVDDGYLTHFMDVCIFG